MFAILREESGCMRLKTYSEKPTAESVTEQKDGYVFIHHPIEWIELCIELDAGRASLLPASNKALKLILQNYVVMSRRDICTSSVTKHGADIRLSFNVLRSNPFGASSTPDDIARTVLKQLEQVFHELKEAD
jgi:hypothetical protein